VVVDIDTRRVTDQPSGTPFDATHCGEVEDEFASVVNIHSLREPLFQ
jgi:hypothetical protein